jgi:MerR family transcriptional regulator, thiopeptide resistance regulator
MKFDTFKVGDLARRTGLTVRTLHHYDEIGLVKPSGHTDAGHRLYTGRDVARLQQVLSLHQLGFSLEEIRECLNRPGFSPLEVIRLHIARLREQIERQQNLYSRLETIAAHLERAGDLSTDDFLKTIEEMTMIENYYTPEQIEHLKQRATTVSAEQIEHLKQRATTVSAEQIEHLKQRATTVSAERIEEVQKEWPVLIALVRAEKEKGTEPLAPQVLELARRWVGLINEFTGGDAGIERSLGRLWKEQGDSLVAQHGTQYDSRDLIEYLGPALAAVKGSG